MFSINRFFEQFKIILRQNAQRQILNLALIALIFLFCHFAMYYQGIDKLILDFKFWGFVVAIMTITNSINVFSALLRTDSGINYYMTPASIGEKYAAAWLYSSIFTIAAYTSVIYLVHLASINLGNVITGRSLPYFFPDRETYQDGFLSMMFLQSLFFLGAVVFRKNPFGKTILTIVLFGFIISLISAHIMTWYLQGADPINTYHTASYHWTLNMNDFSNMDMPAKLENLMNVVKIIGWCIPFICWTAAYFRLKTREV
ncbi:MAG: hypothetical protein PHS30_03335 [Bacteroidales bacterium]|nr:hypothetical protein [Bacteroidales bacterium]